MAGFNPFAKKVEQAELFGVDQATDDALAREVESDRLYEIHEAKAGRQSAWDRLDSDYRALCEKIAGPRCSPQNKRVRALADSIWLTNKK